MKSLLKNGVDVNAPQADGMTALHWSSLRGEVDTTKLLLKAGAKAQVTNRYGITPLSLACENGNALVVEMLLHHGADASQALRGGETPIMLAARTGDMDSVKALVKHGADVNAKEKAGQTAMMWAAAEGHASTVDFLISSGADFKTPLSAGFTPFLFAVREGHMDVVKVLLKAGADVNEAVQPKRRMYRGVQPGMTPLILAVENGHLELALDLVKAGSNPNDQRAGYTALHNLTWVRKPNHGEDEDGMPPPEGSGNVNSLEFVKKIVEFGADINAKIEKAPGGMGILNRTGATPFLLAAKTADISLLKLLHELGADPSLNTIDGVTPLMAAAGLGTLAAGEVAGTEDEVLEVMEWLVGLGADVNAVDKNGETAMHAAAYKNLPKVVEFLAKNGAQIQVWNVKNKYGWTPLLIAEGFRPGNFKPSFETIEALHQAMRALGVEPPPLTSAAGVNNSDFAPR